MNKIIYPLMLVLAAATMASCSDFFDPDTDDELNGEEYISSDTEMYTGFLGIMTKLQAVGDKQILLTETRGELVEVTETSTPELIAIYNYEPDLEGNPYANPAGYYEVIIACNDYLAKMHDYRKLAGVDDDIWKDLVSSTVRIKAWTYKTLAETYGEAVWFDSPLTKLTDLTAENGFVKMPLAGIIDKCLELMDTGYDGVPSTRTIDWIKWLDPDKVTDVANSSYRKWNYMVPPYEGVYAELCLWKGAAVESLSANASTTDAAATAYYQKAANVLLSILTWYADLKYKGDQSDPGSSVYWLPSAATPGQYKNFFDYEQPFARECAAAIIYDYANNQTNTLLKHFSNEYPNKYLLRPNEKAVENFISGTNENEARYKATFGYSGGVRYISKFRPVGSSRRPNPYQDDVHIYLYRATQYHMLLAEALNHLKRFTAMDAVFNTGVNKEKYVDGTPEWEGFSRNWTSDAEWGTRKYPSMGIRCCYGLTGRHTVLSLVGTTEREAMRANDMAILDESMLEFACEGKVYPMMNRMALRYADLSIIADRVAPKYEARGLDGQVRGRIEAGGNWVPYDLRVMADNR